MNSKNTIFLAIGFIAGWLIREKVMWLSFPATYQGGPAGKVSASQAMKNTLWGMFFFGLIINTIRKSELLDIWKNDISSGLLIGLGIGAIIFSFYTYTGPIAIFAELILYWFFILAGYGVGVVPGLLLRSILHRKDVN